jgi:hypothetical protein
MSAFVCKAYIDATLPNVCYWHKADTIGLRWHVCFWLEGELAKSEDLTLPRPPNGSYFPATSAAAEERVVAVGLEARHGHAGRHVDLL